MKKKIKVTGLERIRFYRKHIKTLKGYRKLSKCKTYVLSVDLDIKVAELAIASIRYGGSQ